ncbi:MAG TPA: DUF2141 domain-containing protein [bacterium]|nr:DUF2141 domain-containing protein [bacterium]
MHRTTSAFILAFIITAGAGYTLSGTVSGCGRIGTVFVAVFDEDAWDAEMPLWHVELNPPKSGSTMSFSFTGIPPGEYAIFAFQDEDYNGTLNLGLLGPTEPWGTYRHVSIIPTFSAMAFKLNVNKTGIKITIS